jgi:predicted glycosyltransferase
MGQLSGSSLGEVDCELKVWLDILTPKQANLLGELQHRLDAKGFKTFLTTRQYREVNELLQLKNLKATPIGRHGGGKLKDKLIESSNRVSALAEVVQDQNVDVAISFASPEAARVAFGLRISHYCISDSPHAEAVSRLTIPLSEKLFTPWIVPTHAWTRYGINPRDVVKYRALDPIAWLPHYKGNPKALDQLNLDLSRPVILVRTPEEYASYLSDRHSSIASNVTDIVAKIIDVKDESAQVVILPRYDLQGETFKKRFDNRVIVPEHVIDSIPLMRVSSVFLGGGGTMTAEAALLGVPVISYYPGDATFVERFLIKYGLVERLLDPGRIAQRASAICKSQDFREFYQKRSARLLRSMEDPLRVIVQRIFKH